MKHEPMVLERLDWRVTKTNSKDEADEGALICTRVELPPPPFGSDQMLCAHEPKLVSACLVLVSMQTGLEVKVVLATFMYVGIYSDGTVKGKKQRKELVAALLKNKLKGKELKYPKRDATKLTGASMELSNEATIEGGVRVPEVAPILSETKTP